jgi:FxsC-like protein
MLGAGFGVFSSKKVTGQILRVRQRSISKISAGRQMVGDWFFLSYARLDRDGDPFDCIRKFNDDLDREIRQKKVIRAGSAGFYDGAGIQQGDQWPETLGSALNSCRVLVSIYSPAYFDSEYCGKELSIFNARVDRFLSNAPRGTERPRLILPVLLYPPHELGSIPGVLADTQYADDGYPEIYRQEGLRYMFKRSNSELKDRYQDFLDMIVKKVLEANEALRPPPLPALPDIKTVESAFHRPPAAGAGSNEASNSGPRYANFVYVAGRRDEIHPLGRNADNYGIEGELDWRPYWPESPEEVGLIAQSAATKEGFRYQPVPLDANLITFINEAETNNRIVIVIVDTWTLRVQKYKRCMQDYDRLNFANCAVLIVWNDRDSDTARERATLEYIVRQTFLYKARVKDPNSFIDNIGSLDSLTGSLGVMLQKVSAQIIETNNLRRIEAAQMIGKPEITGPGAART